MSAASVEKSAFVWTDENTAEAISLYVGGMSAARVAERIGAPSRNSVIGKMHRKNIDGRREPSAPKDASTDIAPKEKRIRMAAIHLGPPIVHTPPPPAGITIMELRWPSETRQATCRWPIGGTGAGMKYCGAGCRDVYCTPHAKLAFQPLTAAQKRATLRAATWVVNR